MAALLAGLAAFSFGAHLRARSRVRMRPEGRQARQVTKLKAVDRSKNGTMGQALSFPEISQGTFPTSRDCRCR